MVIMSNNSINLDSTAEALEALMRIRSSPSSISLKQRKLNHDANTSTGTTINNKTSGGNTNTGTHNMSSQGPITSVNIPIAPLIHQYPMNGVQNRSFNFPLTTAAAISSQQQINNAPVPGRFPVPNSMPEWQVGMQGTHRNMHSYVNSSMATYLNPSPNPSPQILSQSTNNANSQNQHQEVRPSEVERALRSKPQRGKKRNNLNIDERKELTRSRNRLHAKTTRQRKKARYDELVECERKYLEFIEEQKESNARKENVMNFIRFCSGLINSQQSIDTAHANEPSAATSTWTSMFGGHESSTGTCTRNSSTSNDLNPLEMFAPGPIFSVTSIFGLCRKNLNLQGLQDCIQDGAHDLKEMFSSHAEAEDNIKFSYVIPALSNDVAISKSHSAFCAYHIVASDNESSPLSSGHVHVRFVEQSHRIAAADIHTTSMEHNYKSDAEEASSSPLGDCEAFPSVVSLEKHSEKQKERQL